MKCRVRMEAGQLMTAVVQARDDVSLKWGTRGTPSSAPLCRSQGPLQFVLARKAFGKEKMLKSPESRKETGLGDNSRFLLLLFKEIQAHNYIKCATNV